MTPRFRIAFAAGIGSLALFLAVAVVPAPWRLPVSNDEMLHLESYRNQYHTSDVFRNTMRKIDATPPVAVGTAVYGCLRQ